jgi:hypothetical protein
MPKAEKASVSWESEKKEWHIRVKVGQEVIKRRLGEIRREASKETLRAEAVEAVNREGYDIEPAQVEIQPPSQPSWRSYRIASSCSG